MRVIDKNWDVDMGKVLWKKKRKSIFRFLEKNVVNTYANGLETVLGQFITYVISYIEHNIVIVLRKFAWDVNLVYNVFKKVSLSPVKFDLYFSRDKDSNKSIVKYYYKFKILNDYYCEFYHLIPVQLSWIKHKRIQFGPNDNNKKKKKNAAISIQ